MSFYRTKTHNHALERSVTESAITIFWFWPQNAALWAVSQGAPTAETDPAIVREMVQRWVAYDWLRVTMGFVGLVAAVKAISVPFPTVAKSTDHLRDQQRGT